MYARENGPNARWVFKSTLKLTTVGVLCFIMTRLHAGNLATESDKNVSNLLERVSKKQRKSRKLSKTVSTAGGTTATLLGDSSLQCGAPAVVDRDAVESNEVHKDDVEDEWEDVGHAEDDEYPTTSAQQGAVVVQLEHDATTKPTTKRQAFTKEDKYICEMMHRSHILCLIARGLLYDEVADDPWVQAAVMSRIPEELLSECNSSRILTVPLLENLNNQIHKDLTITSSDESLASLHLNYGKEDVVTKLLDRAGSLTCTVEESCTLFAALLRNFGYLVRTVHSLEPSALKPGDLMRQIQQRLKRKEKPPPRQKKSSPSKQNKKTSDTNKQEENGHILKEVVDEIQGKKNKADIELETAVAVAMEATSWIAGPLQDNQDQSDKKKASSGVNLSEMHAKHGHPSKKPSSLDMGKYWLEVFCGLPKDGQWVHCDPARGICNKPNEVEGYLKKNHQVLYVIGFSGGGAKDVTRKYVSSFLNVQKRRDNAWWDQTMSILRRKERRTLRIAFQNIQEGSEGALELVESRENIEMEHKVAKELKSLPTTIDGFKNHKEFILKRHINKYQILLPGSAAVGVHKGEPYYLRKDLRDIHTADRWKRLGRQVKAEELDKPCKMIKKKGTPSNPTTSSLSFDDEGDMMDAAQAMSSYYAEWQTEHWSPPPAVDGKVPKNDRGNVEVPPFATELPKGTVHIQFPQIAKVCKRLEIDFAPALAGFDIRGGRSVPRIDGVVVCEEFKDLVTNAYYEYTRHQAELAKAKRLKEGEAAWRDLISALITHHRVQKSYAGDSLESHLLEHASLKKDPAKSIRKAPNPKPNESPQVQGQVVDPSVEDAQLDMEEI